MVVPTCHIIIISLGGFSNCGVFSFLILFISFILFSGSGDQGSEAKNNDHFFNLSFFSSGFKIDLIKEKNITIYQKG